MLGKNVRHGLSFLLFVSIICFSVQLSVLSKADDSSIFIDNDVFHIEAVFNGQDLSNAVDKANAIFDSSIARSVGFRVIILRRKIGIRHNHARTTKRKTSFCRKSFHENRRLILAIFAEPLSVSTAILSSPTDLP